MEEEEFNEWLKKKIEGVSKQDGDFISSNDIAEIFCTAAETTKYSKLKNFNQWYNFEHTHKGVFSHTDKFGQAQYFSCNEAVDEYFKNTSYNMLPPDNAISQNSYQKGSTTSLRIEKQGTTLEFISLPAYGDPAFATLVMSTKPDVLIVPLVYFGAGKIFYPSIRSDIGQLELVVKDLLSTQTLEATFDGQIVHGCTVIRKKPLKVYLSDLKNRALGIPEERITETGNFVEIFHGGFYLPFQPMSIKPGDHEVNTNAIQPWFRKKQRISIMAIF